MDLALPIAAGAALVVCALALSISARDRGLPLTWWQGASVILLVGAPGWTVGALLSPERRLLYTTVAAGLLLPPAFWLWARRDPRPRHGPRSPIH